MGSGARSPLSICALRVSRLNANGSPAGGNTVGAVSVVGGVGYLKWTAQYVTGDDIAELDGCGNLSVVRKYQDKLKRFDVELDFLVMSHELRELSYGASLLTSGPNVVGHADLVNTACGSVANANGVCVEGWAENWLCATGDASFPYQRVVFPRVFMTPSDGNLQRGVNHVTLKGYAQASSTIADGPFNDFPSSLTALSTWARAAFDDTVLPAASSGLGYVTTPSQS